LTIVPAKGHVINSAKVDPRNKSEKCYDISHGHEGSLTLRYL
jgi:hypothetical protein